MGSQGLPWVDRLGLACGRGGMDGRTLKMVSSPRARALLEMDRTPGGLASHAVSLGWCGHLRLMAGEGHPTAYVGSGFSEQPRSKRPSFFCPSLRRKAVPLPPHSIGQSCRTGLDSRGKCFASVWLLGGAAGSTEPTRRPVMTAPLHIHPPWLWMHHLLRWKALIQVRKGHSLRQ